MHCMPFPLSLLCHLDNRLYGKHDDSAGLACRAHDLALHAHWRLMPRWSARFLRKITEED